MQEERETGRVQRREIQRLQRETAFLQEALDAKGPAGNMQREFVQETNPAALRVVPASLSPPPRYLRNCARDIFM